MQVCRYVNELLIVVFEEFPDQDDGGGDNGECKYKCQEVGDVGHDQWFVNKGL